MPFKTPGRSLACVHPQAQSANPHPSFRAKMIWLNVAEYNPTALAFYERYGFEKTDEFKKGERGKHFLCVLPLKKNRAPIKTSRASKQYKSSAKGFGGGSGGAKKRPSKSQAAASTVDVVSEVAAEADPQAEQASLATSMQHPTATTDVTGVEAVASSSTAATHASQTEQSALINRSSSSSGRSSQHSVSKMSSRSGRAVPMLARTVPTTLSNGGHPQRQVSPLSSGGSSGTAYTSSPSPPTQNAHRGPSQSGLLSHALMPSHAVGLHGSRAQCHKSTVSNVQQTCVERRCMVTPRRVSALSGAVQGSRLRSPTGRASAVLRYGRVMTRACSKAAVHVRVGAM